MKQLYLLVLLFVNFMADAKDPGLYEGYIVTLSGIQLTGHVGSLTVKDDKVYLTFINDFGSIYQLSPRLIRGFVCNTDYGSLLFESWRKENGWSFLGVVHKDAAMSLYIEPSFTTVFATGLGQVVAETQPVYYLHAENRLIRISATGFKAKMQQLLQRRAPALARKIGTAGYRFRDLERIVREYNDYCRNNPYLL